MRVQTLRAQGPGVKVICLLVIPTLLELGNVAETFKRLNWTRSAKFDSFLANIRRSNICSIENVDFNFWTIVTFVCFFWRALYSLCKMWKFYCRCLHILLGDVHKLKLIYIRVDTSFTNARSKWYTRQKLVYLATLYTFVMIDIHCSDWPWSCCRYRCGCCGLSVR